MLDRLSCVKRCSRNDIRALPLGHTWDGRSSSHGMFMTSRHYHVCITRIMGHCTILMAARQSSLQSCLLSFPLLAVTVRAHHL